MYKISLLHRKFMKFKMHKTLQVNEASDAQNSALIN